MTQTATNNKVSTLDIRAKEWFDKTYGNSYHSAQVIINLGQPDERTIYIPFTYGYDDAYIDSAGKKLQKEGILNPDTKIYNLGRFCDENHIVLRTSIQTNCLQRDVKAWGAN